MHNDAYLVHEGGAVPGSSSISTVPPGFSQRTVTTPRRLAFDSNLKGRVLSRVPMYGMVSAPFGFQAGRARRRAHAGGVCA
jgi:hypothetical protein